MGKQMEMQTSNNDSIFPQRPPKDHQEWILDEGHPKVHELGHEIPKSIGPLFLEAGPLQSNRIQGRHENDGVQTVVFGGFSPRSCKTLSPHSRSFTVLCGKRTFPEANKCQGHGLESHRF